MLSQSIRRALIASSLLFGTMAAMSPAAFAGSASDSIGVDGSVANNCTISAGGLSFAPYDYVVANKTANLDGTATLTVACTKDASTAIALGLGANASSAQRRLTDGTNFLTYELYQESGRSTVWGTTAGTNDKAYTGVGTPETVTVYGRVAGGQNVPSGAYTDTIQATITF